jgi:hypothetical protein
MQLAVCWPLAPMAHSLTHSTKTKKPAQLGINRDGQTSGRQRGYAQPLYSRFLLQAYSVRVDQNATTSAPLTFVRSPAPGLFRERLRTLTTGTLHCETTFTTGALDDGHMSAVCLIREGDWGDGIRGG